MLCSLPKASINTSTRLHFCSSGTKITFHVWGLNVEVLGRRKTLLIYVPNLKCLIVVSVKKKKKKAAPFGYVFGPEGCCVAVIQAGMKSSDGINTKHQRILICLHEVA